VYAAAEEGIWREGWSRTTPSSVAELIGLGQIAVATRDGRIAGCIRVHEIADDASEFGLLASAPEVRGRGVGRALVAFAEEHGRARGRRVMRLELLVPRAWRHPGKELLRGWYGRLGYRLIATGSLEDAYPQLRPLLATPCDLETYEKALAPAAP
jgi:GNAT superfamily N-acetyltransferase